MRFAAIIISLVAITVAEGANIRRQGTGTPVYKDQTFNELSISEGPAGNAQQKALDRLAGLPADLATVTDFDLEFLDNLNGIANQAERGAFDTAMEALAADPQLQVLSLDCGKTANKVLKLQATLFKLQIQKAQKDPKFNETKLAQEEKKFANNVEADEINGKAGLACVSAPFDATTANVDATENPKNKTRELAAENAAFASRNFLGLTDPPASKLARENAEKSVAAEKAAGGNGTTTK